jgi:hypothetical protein
MKEEKSENQESEVHDLFFRFYEKDVAKTLTQEEKLQALELAVVHPKELIKFYLSLVIGSMAGPISFKHIVQIGCHWFENYKELPLALKLFKLAGLVKEVNHEQKYVLFDLDQAKSMREWTYLQKVLQQNPALVKLFHDEELKGIPEHIRVMVDHFEPLVEEALSAVE